jgi:hypothetical protein
VGFPAGPQSSPVPAKNLPVGNQPPPPHKTEGLATQGMFDLPPVARSCSLVSQVQMNLSLTLLIARACHQHSCRLQSHVREVNCNRGLFSSSTKTTSLTTKFLCGIPHFCFVGETGGILLTNDAITRLPCTALDAIFFCHSHLACRKHRVGHLILSVVTVDG